MKKVICIVGPTGSGKTSLSIKLAKHYQTDLINADSVCVYRELNIGSAKVTKKEADGIFHHLLDIRSVGEDYTIYNFQHDARLLINELKLPIFVGGSGLYLKAALYNYQLLETKTVNLDNIDYNDIYQKLLILDPNLKIDPNNHHRIISAYRQALSGHLRSEKKSADVPLYQLCVIYLDIDRVILRQRVIDRLDQMIELGLIEETKQLLANNHQLNIIGYKEITEYLNGKISLDGAKEKIITATMRYAKRQKTWFKNQMAIHIVNGIDANLFEMTTKIIDQFLKE